jgi:hypothetical protein
MNLSPYPSPAAILHGLAMESGLVSATNEGKDDGRYRLLNRLRNDVRFAPWQAAEQALEHVLDLIEQTSPLCAPLLKVKLVCGLDLYTGLSERVSAECIDRPSLVNELLWPDVFAPWAAGALMALRDAYPGLDLAAVLQSERPFVEVLRQILKREALTIDELAKRMGTRHEEPTDRRKRVQRWFDGHLPQTAQLKALSRHLGGASGHSLAWLVAGRLLAAVDPVPRMLVLLALNRSNEPVDVGLKISTRNYELSQRASPEIFQITGRLLELLHFHSRRPRQPDDREECLVLLDRMKLLSPSTPGAECHLHWLRARFAIFDGRLDDAVMELDEAIKGGRLACPNVKGWCSELVFVADRAKNKVLFRRYYRWLSQAEDDPNGDSPDTREWLDDHFSRFYPSSAQFTARDL